MKNQKVKICCISSVDEATTALEAGANVLGLVSEMPSGPGVISNEVIIEIINKIPNHIETFLLTSKMAAVDIFLQHQKMPTTGIQIVDYINVVELEKLRALLPNVSLVQVIHVTGPESIDLVKEREEFVDYILLDSGKPNADIKLLGGTGNTHNWDISAEIVSQSNKPVFLAGGLKTANVAQAIKKVKPYGVDLCSGVRSNSKLDSVKLQDFMNQVRGNA